MFAGREFQMDWAAMTKALLTKVWCLGLVMEVSGLASDDLMWRVGEHYYYNDIFVLLFPIYACF